MPLFDRFRGSRRSPESLFAVYDTGGAGRLVGVFDERARAEAVVAANPAYYRLTACTRNAITAAALDWAAPEIRAKLGA